MEEQKFNSNMSKTEVTNGPQHVSLAAPANPQQEDTTLEEQLAQHLEFLTVSVQPYTVQQPNSYLPPPVDSIGISDSVNYHLE